MIQAPSRPLTVEETIANSKKSRSSIGKIAIFLFCQLVAILLVELILNWSGIGEEEIMAFDPDIAYVHMGNKHVIWRREGYSESYFDAQGMREPNVAIAKPANTYRIALLGDSMVEGLQVPLDDTFGRILERRLSKTLNRRIEVLNFGVFGYSTLQEFLLLQKNVLKYNPDLVLLCYNERDMLETIETWTPRGKAPVHGRPYAIQFPGHPFVIDTLPVKRLLNLPKTQISMALYWVRQKSHIWGVLTEPYQMSLRNPLISLIVDFSHNPKRAFQNLLSSANNQNDSAFQIQFFEQQKNQVRTIPGIPDAQSGTKIIPKDIGKAIMVSVLNPTMTTLLDKTKRVCEQAHAKLAVIALPTRTSLSPLPQVPPPALYGPESCGIDYNQEIEILKTACKQDQIPLLNCEDPAKTLSSKELSKLFFTMHYTRAGQSFIAQQLFPFLKAQI
jgi:hypothetical protein